MEKLDNIKEFLLEHKYWVIGSFCILIVLGVITCSMIKNSNSKNESLLEEIGKWEETEEIEESEKIEECFFTVDIKGEVIEPGLYELSCDSRVQDVIDLAGGITDRADTSVLNLSRKIIDEMVVVVYSKEEVANFVTTKKEEKEKQVACEKQAEIKNDACIKDENRVAESIVIGEDTPVKSSVSLNTASKEELMTLSGIGASKAEAIILYRQEHGSFQTIEELKNVKGIGDKIFEKIKDNITV